MMPSERFSRCGSSSCIHTAHIPMIPFKGVLSSCEMLAMNSVLLSLAASAAFLLSSSSAVLCCTRSSSFSYCIISSSDISLNVSVRSDSSSRMKCLRCLTLPGMRNCRFFRSLLRASRSPCLVFHREIMFQPSLRATSS